MRILLSSSKWSLIGIPFLMRRVKRCYSSRAYWSGTLSYISSLIWATNRRRYLHRQPLAKFYRLEKAVWHYVPSSRVLPFRPRTWIPATCPYRTRLSTSLVTPREPAFWLSTTEAISPVEFLYFVLCRSHLETHKKITLVLILVCCNSEF